MEGAEGESRMMKGQHFPSNFDSSFNVLSNYYTQPVRIVPSTGQQTLAAGDELIITLPPASVVDLRTFQLFFQAETKTNANTEPCGFPKHIASLIQTLDIYVNGVNIQHIDNYNLLYNIYKDMYGSGEQESKQAVSTNADPSLRVLVEDAGNVIRQSFHANAAVATANQATLNYAKNTYCIKDWVGFLGSCRPSIIDTNLFGSFEIRMRLAPDNVLWRNVGTAAVTYEISNLYAYINRIDWKSPDYYSLFDAMLSSGGSMNIPYNNFRCHIGNALTNSKTNIMRFTESTQSLNKVIWTYRASNYNTIAPLQLANNATAAALTANAAADINTYLNDTVSVPRKLANYETFLAMNYAPLYNSSQYFRRNGLGLGSLTGTYSGCAQLEVNSQLIPSYPLTLPQVYQETLKAFNLLSNDKGIHSAIKDISHYERDFFVGAFALSHFNHNDSQYLISGFDSASTSIQLALHVTNNRTADAAQSGTPVVFTSMDAVLKVSSGRQILPIF